VTFVESQTACRTLEPFVPGAPPAAAPRTRFHLHRRNDETRSDVERLIADVYRQHYAAQIEHFMPVLVSRGTDDDITAAAGYRSGVEPLFLERYLAAPVEQALARVTGRPVARESIVEIGQFASRSAGEGRRLMLALARHLVDSGFCWAVITATADLRRLIRHQGLSTLPLGTAQRHCVGDEAPLWGTYYRHAPKVLAGDLQANLVRLERGRR